jgi:sugar/nucleoside kinase (ribokinase family)
MQKTYSLFSLGNALMDYIFTDIKESFLSSNNLTPGDMHLINAERAAQIDQKLKNTKQLMIAGGSATNVACGFANLGGSAAVAGSIGRDKNGEFFEHNLVESNITPLLSISPSRETGVARTFITQSAQGIIERTFATNLGAAPDYKPQNLPLEEIKKAALFHTTGYTFQAMKDVFMKALDFCRDNKIPVSLDLSSPSVITAYKDQLFEIVCNYASYIFMNEDESCAFTGSKDPLEAINSFKNHCETIIIKLGPQGSVIFNNNKEHIIKPFKADTVKDVNGAGDGYTAGFLYGLSKNMSIEKAGSLGSLYGSLIVQHYGARLPYQPLEELKKHNLQS